MTTVDPKRIDPKRKIDELCDYLGYDLGSPMCDELHDHIAACPDCRSYIETINLTVNICRDGNPETPAPAEVKEALFARLKAAKEKKNG